MRQKMEFLVISAPQQLVDATKYYAMRNANVEKFQKYLNMQWSENSKATSIITMDCHYNYVAVHN